MGREKRFLLAILLALLPFYPYAKVAFQTKLYAAQLLPAVRASEAKEDWTNPGKPYSVVRVLSFSSSRAEVYVLVPCGEGAMGFVIKLKNTNKSWTFDNYDTVFSDCGSAKGNTFPPYPEMREF